MQAVQQSVKELLSKIEKLGQRLNALNEELNEVKTENKNLEQRVQDYKAENQQLKEVISSGSSDQKAGQTSPDSQSLRIELEQYIEELDVCIDKLKKL